MVKRYNNLNAALKYLETGAAGVNPIAPEGTYLRQYQEWKSGERNVEYPRDTDSLPGELLNATLNPFALPVDAANITKVPVSKRADDFGGISAIRAKANYTTATTGTGQVFRDFIPAKATIFVPNGVGDGNVTTSKITGVKYKKRGGASYTIPYGATDTLKYESQVRADMIAQIPAESSVSISFNSEDY